MSKRVEKNIKIINFLRKMIDLKENLFAKFSPSITKETKKTAWSQLRDYAVAINLVTADKDLTYIRDTTWPNLRQRTMVKVDRASSTGAPGGSDCKLDNIDELVLEVIGKDSPIVEGIGVHDSLGVSVNQNFNSLESCNSPIFDALDKSTAESADVQKHYPPLSKIKTKRNLNLDFSVAYQELKKRKIELEIRKLELDVWDKENSLGVEHCAITKEIALNNLKTLVIDDSGNIHVVNKEQK